MVRPFLSFKICPIKFWNSRVENWARVLYILKKRRLSEFFRAPDWLVRLPLGVWYNYWLSDPYFRGAERFPPIMYQFYFSVIHFHQSDCRFFPYSQILMHRMKLDADWFGHARLKIGNGSKGGKVSKRGKPSRIDSFSVRSSSIILWSFSHSVSNSSIENCFS